MSKTLPFAQLGLKLNVEYQLRDSFGNIKQLFQDNDLNRFILKFFRQFTNPIDSNGQVKPGLLNYLAAYGIRINFLTGRWGDIRLISNLVTSAGKAAAASRLNGAGAEAVFTYIALGTGTNAAAVGDTALQTELATSGLSRVSASASRVTTSVTNDTAQLSNSFTVTGSAAVTESGILNAASSGTLLCRQVFSAINVVNGDTFTVTWKVQCS